MKNILFLTSLLIFFTSCGNEPEDVKPIVNNYYAVALDTLQSYDDYILGDFGEEFLVTTDVSGKSNSANTNGQNVDSTYIDMQIGYKSTQTNNDINIFVTFGTLESNDKLTATFPRYSNFSDFIDFFDRSEFVYSQAVQPASNLHNVKIGYYLTDQATNEAKLGYSSFSFDQQITAEDFDFSIDSIRVIERPLQQVAVYYSFKCLALNSNQDELKIKNGKGKSTFVFF
ncbi:hypothetical protein MATR_06290 [Marivirga tractuosa]|uniref:Lipoprotein n=1 Tax=Marivirga tractuosa (strain ATCC 23168 / DSM 4126 / NBRC 15989 / NCIMB 1408 / VKM B-1430 / H-43) TaxID=643867 RepID=E4TRL7_MARTH|nr:hypothetical protein [Marivirga tractuosa]ADR21738.1 hypothetical protein Ftrac_1750 [Marivirga tractuosa DSM 4126]BDD13804.1 hypothetical protein MATR_06290 [Marivirga tractuosa]